MKKILQIIMFSIPIVVTQSATAEVSVKGSPPMFTWSDNGGKAYVLMVRTERFETMWQIACSDGTACIKSPVTYGVAPQGTMVVQAPKPLESGIKYTVSGKYDSSTSEWGLFGTFTAPRAKDAAAESKKTISPSPNEAEAAKKIPVYPGAKLNTQEPCCTFTTSDPYGKVVSFYENVLKAKALDPKEVDARYPGTQLPPAPRVTYRQFILGETQFLGKKSPRLFTVKYADFFGVKFTILPDALAEKDAHYVQDYDKQMKKLEQEAQEALEKQEELARYRETGRAKDRQTARAAFKQAREVAKKWQSDSVLYEVRAFYGDSNFVSEYDGWYFSFYSKRQKGCYEVTIEGKRVTHFATAFCSEGYIKAIEEGFVIDSDRVIQEVKKHGFKDGEGHISMDLRYHITLSGKNGIFWRIGGPPEKEGSERVDFYVDPKSGKFIAKEDCCPVEGG
jgi:hypothetical protein